METILYEYQVTDVVTRLRRLQQACLAFIAEPQTRRQVRLIGLLVPLPAFTDFAQPSRTDARRCVAPARQPRVAARHDHSRLQAQAKRRGVTLRCATEVERRLRQARRDARRLARWLRRTSCRCGEVNNSERKTLPRAHDNRQEVTHGAPSDTLPLPVLVIGLLTPQTHKDIALVHAWQHALEARHTSPLRHAHVLQLGFVHMAQLVHDAAVPWGVQLAECLLSHQSLLVDLTSCLLLDNDDTGKAGVKDKITFLREVLPRMAPAKGRCALVLSYPRLLPPPSRGAATPNSTALTRLHQQLRELYVILHGARRVYNWPLCLSYGGSIEALQHDLIPIAAGQRRAKTSAACARAMTITAAPLLQTRALRDVYALTSLLLGYDQADLYVSAVTFYKGLLHRLQNAYCLGLIAPLSARPQQAGAPQVATRRTGQKRSRTHDAVARLSTDQRRRLEAGPHTASPPPLPWEESV